jgi:glucosylceramidase
MNLHAGLHAVYAPARALALALALAVGLATLVGCAAAPAVPLAMGPGSAVSAWVTSGDRSQLLSPETGLAFGSAPPLGANIEVDPSQRFQRMVGFGASITDASAWLIQQRLNPAQRSALLQELFGRGPGGAGFDFARLTIGASDFSSLHYSLDDLPAGETDPALARFSIAPQREDLLPVVRQALLVNPGLQLMASPWSAPAWMKTTGSLIKGTLKPGMEEAYARYLVRYLDAYAAEGVPVFALTLQNEPHFEPEDYPGMRLDPPQRARLIADHLGPLLARRSPPVQLIEWDHNWDQPESPLAVLADSRAGPYVAGVGWHCYAGSVQVQSGVHEAFPDKDTWFTECSGGEWKTQWSETLPWMVRNLVIGATRGWARGVLLWNLALDESHGPHRGGCKDCRGVVTIDTLSGAVTRNLEYYALAHASRHVRPQARRIASTAAVDGLDSVAFRNEDDGSIVLIVCNSAAAERRFSVTQAGRTFEHRLPRESVATYVWPGPH